MSDALAIAISGLRTQEYYVNALANDLANLNTPNYKATQITFEDMLYQSMNSHPTSKNSSLQMGLGSAILRTTKEFSSGPLKPSDNWNDIAIHGPGFFQILNNEGEYLYTRNSTFHIDEEGYLATDQGFRLTDNIVIPNDAIEINIKQNGDVEALIADEAEPQLLGTIQLANFPNPDALIPLGGGLYSQTQQTGEALIGNPNSNGMGSLEQKYIEGSNVNMMSSLMQLTLAQRVYQLNAKAIQIADELEKITNEIHN